MYDKIVLSTHNKGKIREFAELLKPFTKEIITLESFENPPDVIEDGVTFADNARKKAEIISKYTGLPAIADDSGLMVDALNGEPGVYSARYAGDQASDQDNINKLLIALEGVPSEQRTARFVSHIALAVPNEETFSVEDTLEGYILTSPRGENGFGYDPIFYVPAYEQTTAEMDPSLKNKISHRAKALKKLVDEMQNKIETIAKKTE